METVELRKPIISWTIESFHANITFGTVARAAICILIHPCLEMNKSSAAWSRAAAAGPLTAALINIHIHTFKWGTGPSCTLGITMPLYKLLCVCACAHALILVFMCCSVSLCFLIGVSLCASD